MSCACLCLIWAWSGSCGMSASRLYWKRSKSKSYGILLESYPCGFGAAFLCWIHDILPQLLSFLSWVGPRTAAELNWGLRPIVPLRALFDRGQLQRFFTRKVLKSILCGLYLLWVVNVTCSGPLPMSISHRHFGVHLFFQLWHRRCFWIQHDVVPLGRW